ncbi:MAG: hypothetical protein QNJ85_02470 [Gammaproteobacteria bacterium]|nr:hypothetical protein [Gammaproteobacteria bacterium]
MVKKYYLERAIELTDEILELLEEGEFESVWQLEEERQPLIKQAFTVPIEEIDLIRARHLQDLNDQVVDRLSLLKASILDQQKRLKKGVEAVRAYSGA